MRRALREFYAQAERGAGAFLRETDVSMHREEERNRGEITTQVGVVVFAFEDPTQPGESQPETGAATATVRSGSTRRKGGK